jgi:dihydroorotate dehydrogenase (NAD+) catalytic subunit
MKVTIAGVELANPLMTASGCCGYGEELANLYPLSKLGALVTKSITLKPRLGHPVPRTAETASGMLNAIGLANVGIDDFIREKIPFLAKQKTVVIVNVAGSAIDEYVEVSARLNDQPAVDMIELNAQRHQYRRYRRCRGTGRSGCFLGHKLTGRDFGRC